MKINNWENADKSRNELEAQPAEENSAAFYGRTYNEDVPFTQVNFSTFQSILDKRNELLNSVKSHKLD